MTFDFPQLIAHAAKTRPLAAGTIVGSGTISNLDRSRGSACIAEKRMLETHRQRQAESRRFCASAIACASRCATPTAHSIFGAIDQEVQRYVPPE